MNLQKIDIGKRIMETKKQTENLKMELQNLINAGIKCMHKCTNKVYEGVKCECTKLEAVRSIKYESRHSPCKDLYSSKSKVTLISNHEVEEEKQIITETQKNTRFYDLIDAQSVIKKQREKRLQQVRPHKNEKMKTELHKKKLLELHRKSLELVRRNIQAKRQKSNILRKTELLVELQKNIQRNKCCKKKHYQSRNGLNSKKNHEQAKTVKQSKNIQLETTKQKSPESLILPFPESILKAKKIRKNNSNLIKTQIGASILSEYNIEKNLENVHKKSLEHTNLFDLDYSKTRLNTAENNENKNGSIQESDMFDYKYVIADKDQSNVILQNFKETNLVSLITNLHKLNDSVSSRIIHKYFEKSELPTVVRKTENLYENTEKNMKENETTNEGITQYPVWLKEKPAQFYPLNFIYTVKRKLQDAIKHPRAFREVLVENATNKEDVIEFSHHSLKLASDINSFISLKSLNLHAETCTNFQLTPDIYSRPTLVPAAESESATSKNIPDISSESNNSFLSVDEQNGSQLNIDKINDVLLTDPHKVKIDISILEKEKKTFDSVINPTSFNSSKAAILKSSTTESNTTKLLEDQCRTSYPNLSVIIADYTLKCLPHVDL